MHVQVNTADRFEPIGMEARVIQDFAAGLPIVEYRHASMTDDAPLPTLLCFSGGGCSGAVFALLAEECAELGVRVVSFDMPGHTPTRLLGTATPPRALIRASMAKCGRRFRSYDLTFGDRGAQARRAFSLRRDYRRGKNSIDAWRQDQAFSHHSCRHPRPGGDVDGPSGDNIRQVIGLVTRFDAGP